jgi:hypothetical protein
MHSTKKELLKKGGIESVFCGQKIITMPDGSLWEHRVGNMYQKVN